MAFKTGNYKGSEGSTPNINPTQALPLGYEWRRSPEGQLQLWKVDVAPGVMLSEQGVGVLTFVGEVKAGDNQTVILADSTGKINVTDLPRLNTSVVRAVISEDERLNLPEADKLYVVSDSGFLWFLPPNFDPTVSSNWFKGPAVGSVVTTFNGRNGPVVPESGDYAPNDVGALPLPPSDNVRRVLLGSVATEEEIADNLTTNSSDSPLSARQGVILKSAIENINEDLGHQQHCLCDRAIAILKANGSNQTTVTSQGGAFTVSGATSGVPMSDTPYGRVRKLRLRTNTTPGNNAIVKGAQAYNLNTGFTFVALWSIDSGDSGSRLFVGFDISDLSNSPLSNRTNCFGVGVDPSSSNYVIVQNGDTGSSVVTDLGSGFPKGPSGQNIYALRLECEPLSNRVTYRLRRFEGGQDEIVEGSFNASKLPAAGVFLRPVITAQTTSGSQVGLGFISMYVETVK